jgi:hypothetical protein
MDVVVRRKRTSVLIGIAVAGGALMLSGCGGDGGEDATTSTPPANRAPTISGSPPSAVMQGGAYSFTPNASDADGNTLTFSVTNLPAWATFNSATGQLSGTPSAAQIGTYADISIGVSDGSASASLDTFSIQVVATATGSAALTWNPPTDNADGTPLSNLAGYRVYWGTAEGSYAHSVTLDNPGLSSYVVDQLAPATWYFMLTAINAAGVESDYSNAASKQVR